MGKPPSFQFYANDFMDATSTWEANAVGLYVRCLCKQWTHGSIPNDLRILARAIHCDREELENVWPVLSKKFEAQEDGTLKNSKLEAVRRRQEEVSLKRSEAGKAGANAKANASGLLQAKQKQRKVKEKEKVEVEVESENEVTGEQTRKGPDPDVQGLLDYATKRLTETDTGVIAEDAKDRRFAAHSIIQVMRKRWPDLDALTNAKALIDAALADDFHRKHAMKLRYLLKYLDTIRLAAKERRSNPKTQTTDDRKQQLAESLAKSFADRRAAAAALDASANGGDDMPHA